MFLFGRQKSKERVKERLQLMLSYDRARISPGRMEELRNELVQVIIKYFPAKEDELELKLEQDGERMVLVADLPFQQSSS